MVNIVLCGPDDLRNGHVARELKKRCKNKVQHHDSIVNVREHVLSAHAISQREHFNECTDIYKQVLVDIVVKQSEKETTKGTKDFITDNCIITSLVLAEHCIVDRDVVEDIVNATECISQSISKYRTGLVVLLGPQQFPFDDNVWLKLTTESWPWILETYKRLLNRYKIPFIDLTLASTDEICKEIADALSGKLHLNSSNLSYYEKLAKAEKKGSRDQSEHSPVQNNLSFFLKQPSRSNVLFIPSIKVTEHLYEQYWTEFPKGQVNKFVNRHGHSNLACLDFHINVRSSEVKKILINGLMINGLLYNFLGCSSSGLKTRKCYLWKGTLTEVREILQTDGDFMAIQTISKRLSRIALLFSAVKLTTIRIEDDNIYQFDDIEDNNHIFSDGCGLISEKLAKHVFEQVKDTDHDDRYIPSVYQVRFQGYKGVLAVDRNLDKLKIAVRPSMRKFYTNQFPYLGICEYSKPYTFGNLNKQFIQLLSGLGIPDTNLLKKQQQYFDLIEKMLNKSDVAVTCLQWQNDFDTARLIVTAGGLDRMYAPDRDVAIKKLKQLKQKLVSKLPKLNIPIQESRTIFGICDTTGALEYGQCFLRLTISDKPMSVRGQVLVCKNPCYLLGDVRVLTAVDDTDNECLSELNHLKDCIVFPSKGIRPHPDEIAGSDLDGDEYFVTWDKDLIPKPRLPYDYPSAKSSLKGNITHEDTIAYFSRQNETMKLIGKVNSFYNKWADIKNVTSKECELLGQLFSRVIDSGKTGEEIDIPRTLYPPLEEQNKTFVWKIMEKRAEQFESELKKDVINNEHIENISSDFVDELVKKKYSNISEYEKFTFCWRYLVYSNKAVDVDIMDMMNCYIDYINFSFMSVEEKKDIIRKGIQRKTVMNALNKSHILNEKELAHFSMDSPLNTWGEYLKLTHEDFDWIHLFKSLTTCDFNLIVLELPDNVIVGIQILGILTRGKEQPVEPGTISALFYSRHFGYKNRYILGPEYVVDLTEDTFRLYRDRKENLTFIWLKSTDRKATKGRWNKSVDDEVVNLMSVDLQRFNRNILSPDRRHPLINKTPFVKVEIYAQSMNSYDPPYWDSFDANDLLPLDEMAHSEVEIGIDYIVDFAKVFPPVFSIESESIGNTFEHACDNPYQFKVLLESVHEKDFPKDIVLFFTELLRFMVSIITPLDLPEDLQVLLVEILTILSERIITPIEIVRVASYLSRLGMSDLSTQLVQTHYGNSTLSLDDFLSIIQEWMSIWHLEPNCAYMFLQQLSRMIDISFSNESLIFSVRQNYLYKMSILLAIEFIQASSEIREKIKGANSDTKETQNSLCFLKVADIENENIVSFYRTCALGKCNRITKGQHICIQSEGSYTSVVLLGHVVAMTHAPFIMRVRIEGRVPECIYTAKQSDNVYSFRASLVGNVVTFQRVMTALTLFSKPTNKNQVIDLIANTYVKDKETTDTNELKTEKESARNVEVGESIITELNEKQNQAVSMALQHNLSLIQGPPGTGKTKVASSIIKQVTLSKRYDGLLVVGETNIAVDNLARRLKNDVQIVRIGTESGIAGDLYDVSLEEQIRRIADKEEKRAKFKDVHGDVHRNARLAKRVLSAADVVLTTCSGAGDIVLESCQFEFVLVDEATLTMETTLLCSLMHGVKHLVLIGDHKQLGPVIPDTFQKESSYSNLPSVCELSQTLFHRLIDIPVVPSCFLNIQHRMHEEIMKFPSDEFYDGKLIAANSIKDRLQIIFPWPQNHPYKPVCFINVDGRERKYGTSYYNEREIEVVSKVIDTLFGIDEEKHREHRIGINDIGVLTLYQGQVVEIKKRIKCGVTISSVDGFQGQERDVIIVSTVRCNSRKVVGFSGDRHRINVLLTRAKRGLIVVGNKETLQSSEVWERWLLKAPELVEIDIKPIKPNKKPKEDKAISFSGKAAQKPTGFKQRRKGRQY